MLAGVLIVSVCSQPSLAQATSEPAGLESFLTEARLRLTEQGAVIEESIATGGVTMEPDCLEVMHELRDFMFDRVYLRPEAEAHRRQVFSVIHELVDYFLDDPSRIPASYRSDGAGALTQVIDYVAGMTDRYALRLHDTLFRPAGTD